MFNNKNLFIALTYRCNAFCKKCMTRYHINKDIEMSKSFAEFKIPDDVKVVGIGEATHGNREFQIVKGEVLTTCHRPVNPVNLQILANASTSSFLKSS